MTLDDPTGTLGDVRAAIDELAAVDLATVAPEGLLAVLNLLEVESRRLSAQVDRVVDAVDRTDAFRVDGHFSARSAVTHTARVLPGESAARVRVARALRELPELADAYRAGDVPVGSMREVANVAANPRVAHLLAGSDRWFTELCATRTHAEVRQWCREWERRADADGAEQRDADGHARRNVQFAQLYNGTFRISGGVGALQGALMADTLAFYENREFEADLAELRALHGAAAPLGLLRRTPAQRRADAMVAIFRIAGSVDADGVAINDPITNIVIDEETFERAIASAIGAHLEPADPTQADGVLCRTLTGHALGLFDVAEAAFVGHVRRVVVNARGVTIDLGRASRLFRGHARTAVLLGGWPTARLGCEWSGCDAPSLRLQIDHLQRAADGGPTSPWNGRPKCGGHNLLMEAGYRIRYHRGRPHEFLRPDGTPITPAA